MKWIDYREKLGIGFSEENKFRMLKNKIFAVLPSLDDQYSEDSYTRYLIMVCEQAYDYSIRGIQYSLNQAKNTKELISKYIAFYNTYNDDPQYSTYGAKAPRKMKELLLQFIQRCLGELKIQYDLVEDEDGVFIFPKGVEEFDSALVSAPLQWLTSYPSAEKAWSKALREYAESNAQNASDVADKFRKALETFFQEFFGGSKSLENYKGEYGDYLKQRGIPKEIAGNFETLLQAYTNYINNFAKHRDATSDKVLEYLMYQTGNIMRLLITL